MRWSRPSISRSMSPARSMRFKVTVIVAGERFSARAISFWLMPSRSSSSAMIGGCPR